jgi:hypothetical protein
MLSNYGETEEKLPSAKKVNRGHQQVQKLETLRKLIKTDF